MMMNWSLGIAGVCVGILCIHLPAQEPAIHYLKKNITLSNSFLKQTELSEKQVCDRAEKFTVKILSENRIAEGTGILIEKKVEGTQRLYKVLTNAHVVGDNRAHVVGDNRDYQVQTHDDSLYAAKLIKRYDENGLADDLAILQFNSTSKYEIATFRATSTLEPSQIVLAAGFPIIADPSVSRGFKCESGEISLILDREMEMGYRVGYYVDIEKGMSGGPLLNSNGEVVGINGKHSHPIPFGQGNRDFYVYRNGDPVDRSRDLLENSSWAIAIDKLREPKYASIINPPIAGVPPSIPSPVPLPPKPAPPPKPKPPTPPETTVTDPREPALQCNSTGAQSGKFPLVSTYYFNENDDNCSQRVQAIISGSVRERNYSLEIERRKAQIDTRNVTIEDEKPVADRGKVWAIEVRDLDGENETREPEVIVGLIDPTKEDKRYYLVYHYDEKVRRYKKDPELIEDRELIEI
ncbi:MAG: serine protease [Hormoscilla sp.]